MFKKGKSLELVDSALASRMVAGEVAMNMQEPTRPGVPGSRYRRPPRRHSALSSTLGTSGSDSSNNDNTTVTTSATGTSSATAETDPKGKRPMREA